MTNAPEQLTAVFHQHEHLTPDPEAVFAGIRTGVVRARRRRLATLAAGGAAAVAMLIAVPIALVSGLGSRGAQVAHLGSAPGLSYKDVTILPGWQPADTQQAEPPKEAYGVKSVAYENASGQQALTWSLASTEVGAYAQAGEKTRDLPAGEAVDVNGVRGTYRWQHLAVMADKGNGKVCLCDGRLTWQPSPGVWASVRYWFSPPLVGEVPTEATKTQQRAILLRLAREASVVPLTLQVTPWGLRYPMRLTYLPAGVREQGRLLDSSVAVHTSNGIWGYTLQLALDGAQSVGKDGTRFSPPEDVTRAQVGNMLRIDMFMSGIKWNPTGATVDVNGHPARWMASGAGLILSASGGWPQVAIFADLPQAELLKVARGLHVVEGPQNLVRFTNTPIS